MNNINLVLHMYDLCFCFRFCLNQEYRFVFIFIAHMANEQIHGEPLVALRSHLLFSVVIHQSLLLFVLGHH
jgi:hypothetical protein